MQEISTALRNAINAGNPQRVLLAFANSELSNEDISIGKGIELSEEFNGEEDLTIGACPSAVISFDLLNDENQLAEFEFGWFTAYLGARIDSGTPTETTRTFTENGVERTYAFAPLGVFYANKPKYLNQKIISITAYDQMELFEHDMPSAAVLSLTYPTTIGDILYAVCAYYGITCPSEFLNSDLEVAEEPKEFANATIREVISWIAECACSIARFSRDGELELAWFTDTELTYGESDYTKFESAWYSTNAINGAYFRNTEDVSETSEGTGKSNNYLIMDNPFLRGE